jgi:hypothetical protein
MSPQPGYVSLKGFNASKALSAWLTGLPDKWNESSGILLRVGSDLVEAPPLTLIACDLRLRRIAIPLSNGLRFAQH